MLSSRASKREKLFLESVNVSLQSICNHYLWFAFRCGFYQKLPHTEEGIKLTKGFLNLLENQLKSKAKPKEKTSEEEG